MGAFKLGKMTFGSLFKKPETVLYPIQTKPQPMGLKGHIVVDVDSCILCGACERGCPADTILVDKPGHTWSIGRLGCIQCGYCITVCPKKCLSMDPNYAPATTQRTRDSFEVPVQEKTAKAPSAEKAGKPADKASDAKAEPAAELTAPKDEQLAALIALMDPAKADKVRLALE